MICLVTALKYDTGSTRVFLSQLCHDYSKECNFNFYEQKNDVTVKSYDEIKQNC